MNSLRSVLGLSLSFVFAIALVSTGAAADDVTTVSGRLIRAMAAGGESTGWAIQLGSKMTIEGRQIRSLEVESQDRESLNQLQNQRVKASGRIVHRHGIETGDRLILSLTSLMPMPSKAGKYTPVSSGFMGTDWRLEDLAGTPVLSDATATLSFPEAGKVAGNTSCNRFFGSIEMEGSTMKFGQLGSTRMACPEPAMKQETNFLHTLAAAERFEQDGTQLLIYCKGHEKPLRFVMR